MTDITIHNTLLAMLFVLALVDLGGLVYLISRLEDRPCIHITQLDGSRKPVDIILDGEKFVASLSDDAVSDDGIKPGIYYPSEENENTVINEKMVRDAIARANPFRGWDVYSDDSGDE